jgi:hypothetical protein
MKFKVTMKHPDALDYALENLPEKDRNKARKFALQFMEYGEYIDLEFDTEAKTCIVVKP